MKRWRLPLLIIALICLFLFMSVGGDAWGWMDNDACYALFGCNVGFFGYDAIVHIVSSAIEVCIFIWVMRTWVGTNLLSDRLWKNVIILTSCALVIGLVWEFGEFCGDWMRIHWDHINLYIPNHLYQSSNADTVGDLSFGFFGAFVTAWFSGWIKKI